VASHAKREVLRVEAVVEADGEREGRSYGVRLRLGDRVAPPPGAEPIELSYEEVRDRRGELGWCQALATRIRTVARHLADRSSEERKSA
jgi:hypothetical protein